MGNVKATEAEAFHGKKQEKLNMSAAICTAHSIKYKMFSGAAKGSVAASSSPNPEMQP